MSQDVGMQADSNPPLAKSHRLCACRFVTDGRRPPISQLAPRGSSLIACQRRYTRPKRAAKEGRLLGAGDAGGNSAVAITSVSSCAISGHVAAGLTDS
ncbi:hypothetical protein G5I_05318 [Acromyrmex echinatior]|uniref:Uncharacterized protein n=1 Tax=Acromyrmex echinatior TaxID=103372 RepID=F4WHX1_ACREC|nr:hypothetical protein G5I_05318 [Acromyrmex echinatior]